jgi:hypothetical protein
MKILYVTAVALEYNSSANIRNMALISELTARGHDVALLSVEPQKDAIRWEATANISSLYRYEIPLHEMHARASIKKEDSSLSFKIKRLIGKLFSKFAIYDTRIAYAKDAGNIQLREHYDALISSSDPKSSHPIAEEVIKANRDKIGCWIQYWGDPFASDVNLTADIKVRKAYREEARLLALADRVVYTSPITLDSMQKAYDLPEGKAFFVPTPYVEPRIYPPTDHQGCRSLLYTGNYKKDRDILPLYHAVNGNERVRLSIIGDSDIELPEHDNITIAKRVPVAQLSKLEADADVLVCLLNKEGTQIPGKAFHYAATNRPILILYEQTSGPIIDYFEKTGRYVLVPNRKETIEEVFGRLDTICQQSWEPYEPFSSEFAANMFVDLIRTCRQEC